jgi:hypothetical protein
MTSIWTHAFGALRAAPQMVTARHTPVPFSSVLEDLYTPTSELKDAWACSGALREDDGGRADKTDRDPQRGATMTEGKVTSCVAARRRTSARCCHSSWPVAGAN